MDDSRPTEREQYDLARRIVDGLFADHVPTGFDIGQVQAMRQEFAREDTGDAPPSEPWTGPLGDIPEGIIDPRDKSQGGKGW